MQLETCAWMMEKLNEYLSNTAIKNPKQHLFEWSFGYGEFIDDLHIFFNFFLLLSLQYVCYTIISEAMCFKSAFDYIKFLLTFGGVLLELKTNWK
jgi:hypothetical protein